LFDNLAGTYRLTMSSWLPTTGRWYAICLSAPAIGQQRLIARDLLSGDWIFPTWGTPVNKGPVSPPSAVEFQVIMNGGNTSRISMVDVRFWNRVLTNREISQLFDDPWALYRPARTTVRGTAQVTFPPWLPAMLQRRAS